MFGRAETHVWPSRGNQENPQNSFILKAFSTVPKIPNPFLISGTRGKKHRAVSSLP
jgi:hypothetical protein